MSDDGLPYIYGLESPTRCLSAPKFVEDNIVYLIGTQSLRGENQIASITYDDEANSGIAISYAHPAGEIWQIVCPPTNNNNNILATVFQSVSADLTAVSRRAAVWRLSSPLDDASASVAESPSCSNSSITSHLSQTLTSQLELTPSQGSSAIVSVAWQPEDSNKVAVIDDTSVCLWDVGAGCQSSCLNPSLSLSTTKTLNGAFWSPHRHAAEIFVVENSTLCFYDIGSGKQTGSLDNCHAPQLRDVDFNPFDEFYFATCGDDCCVRLWDRRRLSEALRVDREHSHWVWRVRYNFLHDDLVLTGSSDGLVLLRHFGTGANSTVGNDKVDAGADRKEDTASLGSTGAASDAASLDALEDTISTAEALPDGLLKKYEDHEDSVYGVEWSPVNPWIFASLSYDGRLVINRVPQRVCDALTLK